MINFGFPSQVADTIFQSGINKISIFLGSDNPDQYNKLVQPTNGASFSDMCCFVAACVETGEKFVHLRVVSICSVMYYFCKLKYDYRDGCVLYSC